LIPFLGYAPDLDPTTPGILTNCSALVPSMKGMKGAPSPTDTALPALAAACRNALVVRKLDNTTRFIAGTATKLYEAGATSWTEVTRASGGDYGLATDGEWTFAQYADQTLAAAKSDILQVSSSGAFANAAANAPKASIVETVNNFIFLFDVNDQAAIFDGADRPHGWWAARSSATWTPSIANEAYTGDLRSTPGKIRAGRRFGQAIIVYKDRSMYQGIYIGQSGWEFTLIPGEAGAMSQNVVVDVGTSENPKHIFMGFEDFYQFDGSRPLSIGTPLSETVFGEMNKQYSYASKALHDRVNKLVYFYYPVASSSNPDKCVVYNYKTGKWGRDDRSVEAVVEYISAGLSYDDLGGEYATYADLPEVSYDSSFWTSGYPIPAIFNTSHMVQTLNGASVSSSMTTGDYGTDEYLSLLSRVQPLFLTRPSSATMTNYYRENLGDSLSSDTPAVMDSKGRFDVVNGGRSSNWHRALFEFTGPVEMPGIRAEMQEDGLE
jgi:hypothetical protein